jgi:hypothetical protein
MGDAGYHSAAKIPIYRDWMLDTGCVGRGIPDMGFGLRKSFY